MQIDEKHLSYSLISPDIDLSLFTCEDKDLTEFLKDDALKYQGQNLAQTTCVFYKNNLIGYFSLVCDALILSKSEKRKSIPYTKRVLKNYPAIKIARMAFNIEHCRRGLGRAVIGIVKGLAVNLNDEGVAVKFITVDAYEKALGFYKKCGFIENQAAKSGSKGKSKKKSKDKSTHTISMRCNIYG